MIFTREMTAADRRRGGDSTSCRTPSMRKRTMSRFSKGSMWMSEARLSSACVMSRFTRRTTGASEARSFRCSTSPKSCSSSRVEMLSTICPIDDLPAP